MAFGRRAVAREREPLAVGREHGKAVEPARVRDALEAGAVGVHGPQVELAPARVGVVRREDDAIFVRKPERRERGGAEVRDLALIRPVCVHDVQLELRGPHQTLREQRTKPVELFALLRPRRAPDDLRAVGVEERATVVPGLERQPLHVLAVGVHAVQLDVVVARRREDDGAILPAHRRLGVIPLGARERAKLRAVGLRLEDVVAVVERPDVALAHIGPRGTLGAAQVRRRVKQLGVVRKEVAARGRAQAGRDRLRCGGIVEDAHREDAVAALRVRVRLVREPCAVEAPVGLGVLAAERELLQVFQVRLAGSSFAGTDDSSGCGAGAVAQPHSANKTTNSNRDMARRPYPKYVGFHLLTYRPLISPDPARIPSLRHPHALSGVDAGVEAPGRPSRRRSPAP